MTSQLTPERTTSRARQTVDAPERPLLLQPWFLMARVLTDENQPAEARKAFEKSVEIDPDYLPATERLVDLDIADKQFSTAFDRVQTLAHKSIASEADLTKAEARVGVLRAQLGQAEANAQTARLDAQRSATVLDKHFWVPVVGMSLLAAARAQLAFDATTAPGVGDSPRTTDRSSETWNRIAGVRSGPTPPK